MTLFVIMDYFGWSQFPRRINELEEREAFLPQRMYEAYARRTQDLALPQ